MSAGLDTRPNAVTFDLEDLVQKAWEGQIRIPHFQRPLRWRREDVRQLFDSIVKGYPIGSLLLWLQPAPATEITLGNLHIPAPKMDRALWVVDGQQRITSLANALHHDGATDPRFALAYDLRSDQFVTPRRSLDPAVIPLPVLFDLEGVLQWFAENPDSNRYLRRATAITRILRQFKVPAYQVEHGDIDVLRDIFDRLNNYGKRLKRSEIFTALNAQRDAEGNNMLRFELIAANIDAERAFGMIDGDTILKALLGRRNPDVLRDIHREFDNRSGSDFPDEDRGTAYLEAERALLRAVRFLQEDAMVPHVAMLPYRYLLVVLARFFSHHPSPDVRSLQLLRRWYWRAAVIGPEGFKGGTTGAIRALCAAVTPGDLIKTVQQLLAFVNFAKYSTPDLLRFRANESSTKIALCAWWEAGPRSPETGEVFDQSELAESLTDQWSAGGAVRHLIPRIEIPSDMRQLAANRTLVPVLQTSASDIGSLLLNPPFGARTELWPYVMSSHAVTADMLAALATGQVSDFLVARQGLLQDNLRRFLERMCEWGFEDTPPLDEFDLDEIDESANDAGGGVLE